ncbi:MAG TPA: TonB-dependent receptor [Sphingomicrobium sp.]|nr:TonB-dependent receptor [Sphingomicrobium sp.]
MAKSRFQVALYLTTASAALLGVTSTPAVAQSTQPEEQTTDEAPTPTGAATPIKGADLASSANQPTGDIIITGSRIKRDPNESALPLQIVTTRELERNAITSPEQLVSYLPTNGTAADNLASNADVVSGQQRGNNGASFANLRGQGSGATLILLNNRRVAAHGLQGSAVDVNQIPFAVIERVEVLKEGASAIYGTDAIGGVINFILRKDYQGFGVQGFSDTPLRGDHNMYRTSAIAGFGDLNAQGFNIMGAVAYNKSPELRGDERDFVNTFQVDRGLSVDTRGTPHATIFPLGVGPNTPLGTFFPTAGSTPLIPGTNTRASGGINILDIPGGEGCSAITGQDAYDHILWATPTAALACAWDTGRAAVLQQPLKTLTWLGRGVVAFGSHEIFAEATGSDATAIKRFSNLQITPNTTTQNYAHPVGAPGWDLVHSRLIQAFPELAGRAPAGFAYRWRCMECGRREIVTDTKTARYSLGVDGPIFAGWDYRAGGSYAQSVSQSELGSGYYFRGTRADGSDDPNAPLAPGATRRGIIGLLNSGLINPFLLPGQLQSPAALAALQAVSAEGTILYGGKYSVTQLDSSVSGSLFSLPGGTVRAALGVDLRREKYRFNGDVREAAAQPVIIAAPFDNQNALEGASRNIKAAYAEVLVPILDNLEVTAAGRIDHYSGFGSTTNPMINFKYRPIPQLMVRGNYNTGFRVPTFNQLFNGEIEALFTGADIADPAKCPGAVPNPAVPGCESLARSINIISGGNRDLEPETAKMFSLGAVLQLSQDFSASVDFFSIDRENTFQVLSRRQLVDNYQLFPERFIRDSSGTLLAIDQRWINTGGSKTQGLDITLRGALDALGGRFAGGIDGNYLLKKKDQLIEGGAFDNRRGIFSFSGDLGLKWKHNAFVSYGRGPWTLGLTQLYRSSYKNQQLPGVARGLVDPPNDVINVKPYTLYNLSAAVNLTERMRLTGTVKNLFDNDPPFAIAYDSDTGGGSSWEPRVADPRGRAFTMNVDVKF